MMTKEEWEEILHEYYQYRLFTNGLVQKYITRQCISEYIKDHEINRLDNTYTDYHFDVFNTLDASDLKQLIEEHFDNQPLKFDELKEGMWVWDNKYKDYVKLKRNNNENVGKIIIFSKGRDEEYLRIFKDNRFYRKEVKDDE